MDGSVIPDSTARSALDGVVALADLVAYQPGAVVSRTIVKKPAGTVTAFAFDAGEGLSEHTAAFDALVLVTEGESEVTVDGVTHRVAGGQVLCLPASRPHALKALTKFKMVLIMIRE